MNYTKFVERIMPTFKFNWHHHIICNRIDDWIHGKIDNLMILTPPHSSKSTLTSKLLPIYIQRRFNDRKILSVTHSNSLAVAFEKNNIRLNPGSGITSNCRFVAVGKQMSSKFDYGIIDDPMKSRNDAENPALQENIRNWYWSAYRTRFMKNKTLLICSLWNNKSLANYILDNVDKFKETWTVIRIPALYQPMVSETPNLYQSYWKEKYPLELLLDIKSSIGEHNWRYLYQQELD